MIERFIIDTHGPDPEGIRLALETAQVLCEREQCSALLCVPVKNTAEQGVLNQIIPRAQIKRLLIGETLQINGEMELRLESQRTLNIHGPHGVIVALHGSLDMMALIDGIIDCKAIIMIPWTEAEGAAWRAQWAPTVLPGN